MRGLFRAFAVLLYATAAFSISSTVNQVTVAPSGACNSTTDPMQIVQTNGDIYACISNVWTKTFPITNKEIESMQYADQYAGATIVDKVQNAFADCPGTAPCIVTIPIDAAAGAWNAAKLKNQQTVIDHRPAYEIEPEDLPYQKGIEWTNATSLTHTRTERRIPVGFSWATRFLSGGVNKNDGQGAKDHYNPFTFSTIDYGENEGSSFSHLLTKNGRGDAFGASFFTRAGNNCMDGGDECSSALSASLWHNQYPPQATVQSVGNPPSGPGKLVNFSGGLMTSWVGQSRLVIDANPSKVYSTGSVASMTKGPVVPFDSATDTDGTTVVGTGGTNWATQFCGGAGSCAVSDLCFELVPDRVNIDLGPTYNARYYDSKPGKLVYPVRKIRAQDQLQLNPQMQGYLENYRGPSTSGAYRIYRCGSIYEVTSLADNGQSPDTGTIQVDGYTGWANPDSIEVPIAYANWGSVLKLYGQHYIDGKYGSEMITVYDYVDRGYPSNPALPRDYRPFDAIIGGSGEFRHGIDMWGMLMNTSAIRSSTGDFIFGEQCNHSDSYTDGQCANREKRFDNSEIPTGHPNQRQGLHFYYTYETPTNTYTDGTFHVGPNAAYTYAADATAAKNAKPYLDVGQLSIYTNGSIATGGASGTADTSVYVHAATTTNGIAVNQISTATAVFPMVLMRNGTQKLEFECDAGGSAPCRMSLRQNTELSVEDPSFNERARLGNGFLKIGATPAAAGAIRLTNNEAIAADAVGAGDVSIAKVNASDQVELGDTSHTVFVPSSASTGGLKIGASGTRTIQMLCSSTSVNPPSINKATTGVGTGIATGVAANDACMCSPRVDWDDDLLMKGCYATANTLNVRLYNASASAIDAGAQTVDYCCVTKP